MALKTVEQLKLDIVDKLHHSPERLSPGQLVDYIVHLYGEEFVKANEYIARLRDGLDRLYALRDPRCDEQARRIYEMVTKI